MPKGGISKREEPLTAANVADDQKTRWRQGKTIDLATGGHWLTSMIVVKKSHKDESLSGVSSKDQERKRTQCAWVPFLSLTTKWGKRSRVGFILGWGLSGKRDRGREGL